MSWADCSQDAQRTDDRWSALIGGVPVCALYWDGRFSHSSGPGSAFWIDFTILFLMTGYYFLAALGLPNSPSPLSQKPGITMMIAFDCVFWSLMVLVSWGAIKRFRGPAVGITGEPKSSQSSK